jgi:hypothetical protein
MSLSRFFSPSHPPSARTRRPRWLPVLVTLLAILSVASYGEARSRWRKKKKTSTNEPAKIETPLRLSPAGLRFGLSRKQVQAVYKKRIKKDFVKRYQDVEPGIQMRRLEDEEAETIANFNRSWLILTAPPSKLDASPFVGEFGYGSSEAFMQLRRKKRKRTLFFVNNSLWKVIDQYRLPSRKFGKTFADAATKIANMLGGKNEKGEPTPIAGRVRKADPNAGRAHTVVDWSNGKVHLRLMNWGKILAVSYTSVPHIGRVAKARSKAASRKKKARGVSSSVKGALRD